METTVDKLIIINLISLIDLKKKEKPRVFKYVKAVFISYTIGTYIKYIFLFIRT